MISAPVTIKGFVSGTSGAAIIKVPATGLVPNIVMTDAGMVAAQIAAKNTSGVKLYNLTIDGTGGGCATNIGANYTAALALSNVASPDPTWLTATLNQMSIQNHNGGCGRSAGILSEDSYISVEANSIYSVELYAVSLVRGMGKVLSNTIENCTGGAVYIANVTGATVQSNTMASDAFGVRIHNGNNVNVWSNTMGPWVGHGVFATSSTGTWVDKTESARHGSASCWMVRRTTG